MRVDFSEWWDYAPHPDLGIYWYEPDPNDPNRLYYIQRELLKGGSAETGLLLYRVMNATTVDSQGRPVSEWLLIVELAGAGQAISIAGVDYTPGVGIADGFLGIPTAAQSQQLTLTALDMQTSEAVPMGVLEASELGDYLVALDRSDQPFLERTSDNLGLEQSGVITVETMQGSQRGSRAGADQSSGETLSLASAVETSLAVAAKGPGGGGGGDPEPEPPEAGSGFMGIGIVNPEPAPDSAGDDNIRGGKDNDTLIAGAGNVTLKGAGGDDFLEDGAGADVLDGGSGIDTISYASSNSGVQVQLFNGAASGGHAQGDVISNVEHVTGSGFADNLYRDAGDNHLIGLFGNDYFESRGGSDKLDGALETMPSDSRG